MRGCGHRPARGSSDDAVSPPTPSATRLTLHRDARLGHRSGMTPEGVASGVCESSQFEGAAGGDWVLGRDLQGLLDICAFEDVEAADLDVRVKRRAAVSNDLSLP